MSRQARDCSRSCSRSRQPKSLESLYITIQKACSSLQNSLDGICKQCDSLQFELENEHVTEVLEVLDAFDDEIQLAMLSDAQCQLLSEDLDLDLNESTVIDVVKMLRDLELLRKNVSTFFKTLNKRIYSILNDGVYLYSVSLIEITNEKIPEVIEYDEFISNQKLEISQAVEEIHHLEDRWGNLTLDLHSTIDNLVGLQACLTDVQSRWKEIKEMIYMWLKQDRDYPSRLTGRISSNKDLTECLLLEMDVIEESAKRKAEECQYHQDQIASLQKKRWELYNNLGHIQRVKRYNASKMAASESASVQEKDGERNSDRKKDSGCSKSQNEFHRRRDAKLDKEQGDVKASIADVDKKINELKKIIEDEEAKREGSVKRMNEIHIELAVMEKTSVDCREILLRRGTVQTFIQLRKGTLAKSTKGEISFEEACRLVARRVRHEWPRLYLHLPMWPIRNHDQRLEDINGLLGYKRMNVVLPRNRTSIEDAAAALGKWRLLSRQYIDVEGLVTGLRKAGWLKLANEIRKRFVQEVSNEVEELSENNDQEKITESEVVVRAEVEASEDASYQLNEPSTSEEPGNEIEQVTSSGSDEEKEMGKGKNEVRKNKGGHESEGESADSDKENSEANEDDKTECDKSEGIPNNEENQESATDDEEKPNKSNNKPIRSSIGNGDLSEENAPQDDDNAEEIQDAELAEMKEELELTDINNSAKSEKKDKSSARSTQKSSKTSTGSKEEEKSTKEGDKQETDGEYEPETSEIVEKEVNTSGKNSEELNSGVKSIPLNKSPENSPNKSVNYKNDKKEESPRKGSRSENVDSESKEEDDSEKNSSISESRKSDMVAEQTSAKSKNLSDKPTKKNDTKSKDGIKEKNNKKNKKPVNKSKKEEDKKSKIQTSKTKPKDTISKTADSKSKTKPNENAKKEQKQKSKSESEEKNEETNDTDKKEDDIIENVREKGAKKDIPNKGTSKDADSNASVDVNKDEETGSGEHENEDKMTDKGAAELNNMEEEGDQDINNIDEGYKEVKKMQEPESNNEENKSKSKEKKSGKLPSKVKTTEKSTEKKEDKKAAKKSKADKNAKAKDTKKK